MAAFEDLQVAELVWVMCECCKKDVLMRSKLPTSFISMTCFLCSTAQHGETCPPERRRWNVPNGPGRPLWYVTRDQYA